MGRFKMKKAAFADYFFIGVNLFCIFATAKFIPPKFIHTPRMNRKRSYTEDSIYLLVWLLLAIAPLLVSWLQEVSDLVDEINWPGIFKSWRQLLPFLIVFVVHNWLLAPLLVYRRRPWLYFSFTSLIFVFFVFYQCANRPRRPMSHEPPRQEQFEGSYDEADNRWPLPPPEGERFGGNEAMSVLENRQPIKKVTLPPPIMGLHDFFSAVFLLLILALNLSVKYYFKHSAEVQRFESLEKERIRQQLAYLRYQVNPHFFMNTLNNIHSLIDIDPERAQSSIVVLSRLMRYALYEGDHDFVAVQREIDFLHNYVELMRVRCSDDVDIQFDVHQTQPTALMPPLLLVSVVENAFKYGISVHRPSFVHLSIDATDERLTFCCSNSNHQRASGINEAKDGGIGLRNIRQRLDLLFPGDYRLDIDEGHDVYTAHLEIPLRQAAHLERFKLAP